MHSLLVTIIFPFARLVCVTNLSKMGPANLDVILRVIGSGMIIWDCMEPYRTIGLYILW